jgi:hypothetical protein
VFSAKIIAIKLNIYIIFKTSRYPDISYIMINFKSKLQFPKLKCHWVPTKSPLPVRTKASNADMPTRRPDNSAAAQQQQQQQHQQQQQQQSKMYTRGALQALAGKTFLSKH